MSSIHVSEVYDLTCMTVSSQSRFRRSMVSTSVFVEIRVDYRDLFLCICHPKTISSICFTHTRTVLVLSHLHTHTRSHTNLC